MLHLLGPCAHSLVLTFTVTESVKFIDPKSPEAQLFQPCIDVEGNDGK